MDRPGYLRPHCVRRSSRAPKCPRVQSEDTPRVQRGRSFLYQQATQLPLHGGGDRMVDRRGESLCSASSSIRRSSP